MLQVGKLYSCEEYYLLLFANKETAAGATTAVPTRTCVIANEALDHPQQASAEAAYWSRELHNHVSYTEKNNPLLVLNNEGKYIEVLVGDRKGWIVFKDRLNLKEIK